MLLCFFLQTSCIIRCSHEFSAVQDRLQSSKWNWETVTISHAYSRGNFMLFETCLGIQLGNVNQKKGQKFENNILIEFFIYSAGIKKTCVHHQKQHLYMQFFMVCFSCVYVSSLAGGRICSIFELNFWSLLVTWCNTSLALNNCTLCPHCIYVFCIYLRTDSDFCHLQHKLIGFYNWDEKCLQRGTD
jgi:hypothetical protein